MADIIEHPALVKSIAEKIDRKRKRLAEEFKSIDYAYGPDDCKARIGPYFSEERALSENRYLEMYLAQRADLEFLLLEVRARNEKLTILNGKYAKAMEDLAKAKRINQQLKGENERARRLLDHAADK